MSWYKKDVVEDYNNIDLKKLRSHLRNTYSDLTVGWGPNNERGRFGLIINTNECFAEFRYTKPDNTGEKQDFTYSIPLETTNCYFGGKRFWFKCQGIKNGIICNKRVRTLYLGANYFVCRHCLDLSYKSKQKSTYRNPEFKAITGYFDALELINNLPEPKKKTYQGKPTKPFIGYCNKLERAYLKTSAIRSVKLS